MKAERILVMLATLLLPVAALAENYCGDLKNAFGPFDYRKGATEFAANLHLVETAHFTPDVEKGITGLYIARLSQPSSRIGDDGAGRLARQDLASQSSKVSGRMLFQSRNTFHAG
jgi:hypothetical protein